MAFNKKRPKNLVNKLENAPVEDEQVGGVKPDTVQFAYFIRTQRELRKWTREEAARLLEMSVFRLEMVEDARAYPTHDELRAFKRAYHITKRIPVGKIKFQD